MMQMRSAVILGATGLVGGELMRVLRAVAQAMYRIATWERPGVNIYESDRLAEVAPA